MSSAIEQERSDIAGAVKGSSETDEALLLRYRRTGERRPFDQLVHRYERELYSYLRRYLGDATMAEDVFQATFLQIHLKCDQFKEGRRFRPWLYTIATNQAIDAQRRGKRHNIASLDRGSSASGDDDVGTLINLLVSNEPGPISRMESEERRNWTRGAIEDLPETLKATVMLVYYQGLKYRDAAVALQIPVGTVKSRLHAAILKLNQAWTQAHPEEGS